MKKTLRMKIMLLLFALVAGIGNVWATDVTFIAGTDTSATKSITKDGITISVTDGTFSRDDNYRCYAKNTMTIYSEVGNISTIAFTFTGSYTGGWNTSYSPNSNTWTSASASGQARITQIVVSYTPSGGGGGGGSTTYTVTYAAGDHGTGTMVDSNSPYEKDDEVTLLANYFKPANGYKFNSWLIKDASNNTITPEGNIFTMPASNVTVTAQWVEDANTYEWIETTFADLTTNDVFVIVGKISNSYYSMSNNSNSSPAASSVNIDSQNSKITSTVSDAIIWKFSGNSTDGYTFHPYGNNTTWLYCNTTANSGSNTNLRVGDGTRKLFEVSGTTFKTKDSNTARYWNVYTSGSDWRGYTSNSTSTTVKFYKRQAALPTITVSATSLTGFNYVQGTGPSASQSFKVSGANLENDITVSLDENSKYEMSEQDGNNWSSITSKTLTPTNSTVGETTLYVRMKSNQTGNEITGTITATSTNALTKSINLSGSVTPTYTLTIVASNGHIEDGDSNTLSTGAVAQGAEIEITAVPNSGYKFASWSVSDTGGSSVANTTTNPTTFTMGSEATTLTANFEARTPTIVTLHDGLNGATTAAVNTYTDATLADVIEGHSITSVNGWTALGWVKSYNSGAPTLITTTEAVGETTDLYAVYKKGSNTFQRITADSGLEVNATYMICYNSGTTYKFINGEDSNNSGYMAYTDANTVSENSFEYVSGEKFVLGGSAGAYTFIDGTKYLTGSEGAQGLSLSTTLDDYGKWMITMNTYAQIENKGNYNGGTNSYANRYVSYHTKNNYFNCYTSYSSIYLFKQITNNLQYSTAPTAELCHVYYNANGATSGNVPEDNTGYNPNTNVTILGNTGTLAKTGYTWSGWCLNAEGTGTVYGPGYTTTYTLPENTTFYAKWVVNSHDWSTDLTNAVSGTTAQLKVNNAVVAANTQIAFGTEVTVDVTVPNGYIYSISVNNGSVSVTNDKFTMPDENVAVVVTTELNPYEIHTLSSDNMNNTKDENGNAIINSGGTNTSGYGVLKFITTSDGVWISNGYQQTGSGVVSLGMLQLRDRGNDGGVSYIQLPVFNGKIETITMTVTNANGNTSNAGGCKALLNFQTGNTSSETVITSGGDNDNGTGSITLDLTSGFYSTGYITALSATARIWNIDVKIRPYQDMTGTEFTIAADRMVSIPASTNATAENLTIPANSGVIIKSGASLTVSGTLTNSGTAANLIIEDGGRLVVYNEGVQATVKKNVEEATNWGEGNDADGWYFIASPVNTTSYSTAITTGSGEDYDLFMLDWAQKKWLNKKDDNNSSSFGAGFARGVGYLYASEAGNTLSVAGEIQPLSSDNDAKVTLAVDGWNLIGNPLTCKVTVDKAFSELTNASSVTNSASGSAINPFQGIAVYGTKDEVVTFTKATSQNAAAPSNNNSLQMTLAKKVTSRGETSTKVIDNAIVSFNESKGMPKFNMLSGSAKLYIPQNDEEYSVVFSDKQGDLPLNFKANETGTYTISFETNDRASLQGVYLIDILAEEEIDISVNPTYTFIGSPADRTARFKIVFRPSTSSGTDIFAYQNGNDIIVSGEGELQIFDVTGRSVMTTTISGAESINLSAQGVYIFRLIGSEIKTQKIVVR